jgi:4-hydroxybenzoate polyprenyltransferase
LSRASQVPGMTRGTEYRVGAPGEAEEASALFPQTGDPSADRLHVPLVVDLDGTLLRTDILHECALRLIKSKPWTFLLLPFWLLRGRTCLKGQIFKGIQLDYASLPVHEALLEWLRDEKALGRYLVLATASDRRVAEQAVAHLQLFDMVLGSEGRHNLKGSEKVAAILNSCGPTFDYAGNSRADLAVWRCCREAIVVDSSRTVEAAAQRYANVTRLFVSSRGKAEAAIRSLRPYQWVKNLLVFVPAFTSHTGLHGPILLKSTIAFLAFSLCASSSYIANDLFDLQEDRRHPIKRERPFASGECSIRMGVLLALVSLAAGLGLALTLGGSSLLFLLMVYLALTSCYSLYLKRICMLDVITLAILYTMRIIAGHVLTGIPFSVWLLSFAFFLFLSLAFSKRVSELVRLRQNAAETVPSGRGYLVDDLQVITSAGISSAFLSLLVLALYINSDNVTVLYRSPALLWGTLPPLLYYIGRVWIICGRGQLDDDPILYTAKSPSTYYVAAIVLIMMFAATVGF